MTERQRMLKNNFLEIALNKNFRWLFRNSEDDLYMCKEKPERFEGDWYSKCDCEYISPIMAELFDDIRSEDSVPTNILTYKEISFPLFKLQIALELLKEAGFRYIAKNKSLTSYREFGEWYAYREKPVRDTKAGIWSTKERYPLTCFREQFCNVTWEDEPVDIIDMLSEFGEMEYDD